MELFKWVFFLIIFIYLFLIFFLDGSLFIIFIVLQINNKKSNTNININNTPKYNNIAKKK